MKYLWDAWPAFQLLVSRRDPVVFLDYDGTLTPIVRHPSLAKLSASRRETLRAFAQTKGLRTAIVSGRSLAEVKSLVGVPGVIYAGNHGLEFEGPRTRFVHPKAATIQKQLKGLARKLGQALEPFSGIFVEDKGLTLSVHYRELSETQTKRAKKLFRHVLKPYSGSSQVVVTQGKKVWEVRPSTDWNKGTLILWLLARAIAASSKSKLPIYIGDDRTDEDAFKALKDKGIGIKVTNRPDHSSGAAYFLRSPSEVYLFLKRLRALRTKREKFRASTRTA
ncbi:MAG: trehalose-phosphatase [Candidatus Omnitrophica bacterium]|nr:trehalose-phosphatase [Candidatus Omnitrophota bacterium]